MHSSYNTKLPRPSRRNATGGVALLLSVAIAIALYNFPPFLSAAPAPVMLSIEAPPMVAAGSPIEVQFHIDTPIPLGGYEATFLFDPTIAHIQDIQHAHFQPAQVNYIGPLDLTGGLVLGAYGCLPSTCTPAVSAPNTRHHIITLVLLVDQPALLEISLTNVRLVDQKGTLLETAAPASSLIIQVDNPEDRTIRTSQYTPGAFPPPSSPPQTIASTPRDLTGDIQISLTDLVEAEIAWTHARERATPCGSPAAQRIDANGDACLDIADLHLFAIHQHTPQQASAPASESEGLWIVDTIGDGDDANPGDGVCATTQNACSLRAAIREANAHRGPDRIAFAIPGEGPQTIQLGSSLPTLHDESGPTSIDGYSQPGTSPNTDPFASNAVIRVQVVGAGEGSFDGLTITSPGNRIAGLSLFKFNRAILVTGRSARNNRIVGNFIGTDAAGHYAAPSLVYYTTGIEISRGASDNWIGALEPEGRNVVSGVARHGISILHQGTDRNTIVNNIVGLTPDGTNRLANHIQGIDINYGASYNVVGGTESGARNVVSGNNGSGIEVSHQSNTSWNRVIGNFVGTDLTGTRAPYYARNGEYGIHLEDGVAHNIVSHNVVGNSNFGGIKVRSPHITGNHIHHNLVGLSLDGTPIPNRLFGIWINASGTHIGPGNTIAYNPVGILMPFSHNDQNTITQNEVFGNEGLGIDLEPLGERNANDPDDSDSGANEQLNFPVITQASTSAVSGSACPFCLIELFQADQHNRAPSQGRRFIGTTRANHEGNFSMPLSGVPPGLWLTATATDQEGNSSEFSPAAQVVAP